MERVFVSQGDLVADYIYDGNNEPTILIEKRGGGCNWNVLHHLANMGERCYAFGTRGDDEAGRIAESSLSTIGIDISNIELENKSTNIFNLIYKKNEKGQTSFIDTRYSPISGAYTVDFSENLPTRLPRELEQFQNLFVILSTVRPVNLRFLKNITRKKCCLDIGCIGTINEFDKDYLLEFLRTS